MLKKRLWARLFGVEGAVVEDVEFDEWREAIVLSARPGRKAKNRCGRCGKRCSRYDCGEGRRRWRAPDLGSIQAFVEADAPRVKCPEHGVIVAAVPWARHDARCTRAFDDTAAWLATHCSKTAVGELMRTTWRTVGRIVARVAAEAKFVEDRFANLTAIGIDEISYRKGHRYLTVVVDHVRGGLLWAAEGRNKATLEQFFDLLGKERSAGIELVSADGASWIEAVVNDRCPNAELCLDPFHVVKWATDALDKVRREVWNDARDQGQLAVAKTLKDSRWALWKNPDKLTGRQKGKLARIAVTNKPLYRAYLLKEQLREVFHQGGVKGIAILESWLSWACRSRVKPFVKLSRSIRVHRVAIESALTNGLSNARVESMNTRIRLIIRKAFGFHSASALIGLAMLSLGGLCPALPGRG